MESETSKSYRGIDQEIYGLDRIIKYLKSGETNAFNLDRIERFVAGYDLQNGINPKIKMKVLEMLLLLSKEQILDPDYPKEKKLKRIDLLIELVENKAIPIEWVRKIEGLNSDDFRIQKMKDPDVKWKLLTLATEVDLRLVNADPGAISRQWKMIDLRNRATQKLRR